MLMFDFGQNDLLSITNETKWDASNDRDLRLSAITLFPPVLQDPKPLPYCLVAYTSPSPSPLISYLFPSLFHPSFHPFSHSHLRSKVKQNEEAATSNRMADSVLHTLLHSISFVASNRPATRHGIIPTFLHVPHHHRRNLRSTF